MIRTFKDAAPKRYWNSGKAKDLPARDLAKITRLLTSLHAATSPEDMNLPQYRFHQLKGDRKGTYAVTVRGNWRLTFQWEHGAAVRVDLEDYHGD
jgi:proteic killer suppression protein